ncbi:MAG: hypothetical protein V4444_03720 [Pseudomonadota bacterium]
MSIAASPIGELPIAAQPSAVTGTTKTPRKRQIVSRADQIDAPEPR